MNTLDIIPPEFKLTSIINEIQIFHQRKVVPQNYKIDYGSLLTAHMQLNVPIKERTLFVAKMNGIPSGQRELFIAGLGTKDYMDEIVLCVALNTSDTKSFHSVINLLYIRLRDIVTSVMLLTTGSSGSRRKIYQYYFYAKDHVPKKGDVILMGMTGFRLTTIKYDTNDFKVVFVDKLRKELDALNTSEDIPVIDLIDITLDQFNTILRLLPKETSWVKIYKERQIFFSVVSTSLDKLEETGNKFRITAKKHKLLVTKFEGGSISLEELQALSEFTTKDTINTISQRIRVMIASINVFTDTYNSIGILRYRGKTLPRTSSIISDLLNSQFMELIQTFKDQYKRRLGESITANPSTTTRHEIGEFSQNNPKEKEFSQTNRGEKRKIVTNPKNTAQTSNAAANTTPHVTPQKVVDMGYLQPNAAGVVSLDAIPEEMEFAETGYITQTNTTTGGIALDVIHEEMEFASDVITPEATPEEDLIKFTETGYIQANVTSSATTPKYITTYDLNDDILMEEVVDTRNIQTIAISSTDTTLDLMTSEVTEEATKDIHPAPCTPPQVVLRVKMSEIHSSTIEHTHIIPPIRQSSAITITHDPLQIAQSSATTTNVATVVTSEKKAQSTQKLHTPSLISNTDVASVLIPQTQPSTVTPTPPPLPVIIINMPPVAKPTTSDVSGTVNLEASPLNVTKTEQPQTSRLTTYVKPKPATLTVSTTTGTIPKVSRASTSFKVPAAAAVPRAASKATLTIPKSSTPTTMSKTTRTKVSTVNTSSLKSTPSASTTVSKATGPITKSATSATTTKTKTTPTVSTANTSFLKSTPTSPTTETIPTESMASTAHSTGAIPKTTRLEQTLTSLIKLTDNDNGCDKYTGHESLSHSLLSLIINTTRSDSNSKYIILLYDYKQGTMLPTYRATEIMRDVDMYFHGTNVCSALTIIRTGFQPLRCDVKISGSMLGRGTYFTDNIEKTYAYGDVIFICKLNKSRNTLITDTPQPDLKKGNADSIGIVVYQGAHNRDGELVKPSARLSKYNEICVLDSDDIEICYVLKLESLGMRLRQQRELCLYDLKTNTFIMGGTDTSRNTLKEYYNTPLHQTQMYYIKLDSAGLVYNFVPQMKKERLPLDPNTDYTFSFYPRYTDLDFELHQTEFNMHYLAATVFLGNRQLFKNNNSDKIYFANDEEATNALEIKNTNFGFIMKPKNPDMRMCIDPHYLIVLNYY